MKSLDPYPQEYLCYTNPKGCKANGIHGGARKKHDPEHQDDPPRTQPSITQKDRRDPVASP